MINLYDKYANVLTKYPHTLSSIMAPDKYEFSKPILDLKEDFAEIKKEFPAFQSQYSYLISWQLEMIQAKGYSKDLDDDEFWMAYLDQILNSEDDYLDHEIVTGGLLTCLDIFSQVDFTKVKFQSKDDLEKLQSKVDEFSKKAKEDPDFSTSDLHGLDLEAAMIVKFINEETYEYEEEQFLIVTGEKMYSIREVSEIMGISIYTLRYYEKIGLLSFVKRNSAGQREFTKSDIVTLNTVYRLKQTGMSLKNIKHYLDLVAEGESSISERKDMFEKQKLVVEDQIKELNKALDTINAKVMYYREAEKQGTLAVCHDEREAFMQKIMNGEAKK